MLSAQQKVGLVLSGGGAKGLSHIGVIKALEENGIPIDYVAGTSMGAIVGSLYAIGYSPDDMVKLFSSKEFHTWYTGASEEEFTNFSQKMDPDPAFISLRFDFDKKGLKMRLPVSFVPTYQMDLAYLHLFAGHTAAAQQNFDSLFVPFRCVSTDINHKRPLISKSGDLGTAVRASMTFPVYFKPVTLDSMMLFDGGIYNNFPQDVMVKDFNPDFIVGSKTASDLIKTSDDDLFIILENLVMQTTNYHLEPGKGVLVEPTFENVGLLDFYRIDEFVNEGYDKTILLIDSIKQQVTTRIDPNEVNERRLAYKQRIKDFEFNRVNITGKVSEHQVDYLKQIFRGTKRKPFNFHKLKDRYFKVIGSGTVSTIFPTAENDTTTGFFDLNLNVVPNSRFKLSIGGNISSSSAQEGFIGLEYKMWRTLLTTAKANMYYGRLYGSGMVGLRQDIPVNNTIFYELYGIYNRFDYYSGSPDIFLTTTKPSYVKENDFQFRAGLGIALASNTPLKYVYTSGRNSSEYYQDLDFDATDVADKSKIRYHTHSLVAERNTLNHTQFATKGWHWLLAGRYIHTRETYAPGTTSKLVRNDGERREIWSVRLHQERYYTIGKHISLGYMIDAIHSPRVTFSNYTSTMLMAPSFEPTIHSQTVFVPGLRAHSYIGGGIMPSFFFSDKIYLKTGLYTFSPYREIIKNDNHTTSYGEPFKKLIWVANASAVWDTPLGPLSFSVNYYDKQDTKFYFVFNFGYILFNRKGIEY